MNAAIPERRPVTEEISGLIERVTFHNDESGFCVLRVKVRGQREETTVIGSLPSVTAGEWLSAEGWWVRDKEHGLQLKPGEVLDSKGNSPLENDASLCPLEGTVKMKNFATS
jgi:hypothetical protein